MPNLKEIRSRITSVGSTMQITSAMKMVSAAKLKRAQDAITQMRPYSNKLTDLLQSLSSSLDGSENNQYSDSREVKKLLIVSITSNRGLCGGFNSYIIKSAKSIIEKQNKNTDVEILSIGKKSSEHFAKNGYKMFSVHDEVYNNLTFDNISNIAETIINKFLSKEFDKVVLVYNQFKNAATQIIMNENYLHPESRQGKSDQICVRRIRY